MTTPTLKRTPARPIRPLEKVQPINPENWQSQSECFGMNTEWWFPTGSVSTTTGEAKAAVDACNRCPVKRQCAQHVLDSTKTEYPIRTGIWAGIRISNTHSHGDRPRSTPETAYDLLSIIAGE